MSTLAAADKVSVKQIAVSTADLKLLLDLSHGYAAGIRDAADVAFKTDDQRIPVKGKCSVCGKVVYADQGYHGASMDHYDCHTRGKRVIDTKASMESVIAKGDKAMSALLGEVGLKAKKPRARAGTGALAQHVKQLVINALEEELGERVTRADLWLQEGDYRGPKWDLDSWGVNAVVGTGNRMVCCSSLAPMGDYRRCKTVRLGHTDIHVKGLGYDVSVPNEQTKP